ACFQVEESLQFKFTTLKDALVGVHNFFGDDIGTGRGEWPRKTAETMLTIFAHARRLKDEVRFHEASSKLTNHERKALTQVRALTLGMAQEEEEEERKTAKLPISKEEDDEMEKAKKVSKKEKEKLPFSEEEDDEDAKAKNKRKELQRIRSMEIPATPSVFDAWSQDANECSPVPTKKRVLKDAIFIKKKPAAKDPKEGGKAAQKAAAEEAE
ncbi:unnamed protein product, partial [Symbiodinium necroappetens]